MEQAEQGVAEPGMLSPNKATALGYLRNAGLEIQHAQAALDTGELLRAVSWLHEACTLQREAVAALVTGCWQEALSRAAGDDTRLREEGLDQLARLADIILASLCPECRRQIGSRLRGSE
jgi:hypothetical protein